MNTETMSEPERAPRGRRKRNFVFGVVLAAAVAAVAGIFNLDEPLPEWVIDSKARASSSSSYSQIWWADDQTVMFAQAVMRAESYFTFIEGYGTYEGWHDTVLMKWELGKGVRKYADTDSRTFCIGNGNIRYLSRESRVIDPRTRISRHVGDIYMQGPLGTEKRYAPPPNAYKNEQLRFNIYTCEDVPVPEVMKGRAWKPLREGYLYYIGDWKENSNDGEIIGYHLPGNVSKVIKKTDANMRYTTRKSAIFYPFKGAYFIASGHPYFGGYLKDTDRLKPCWKAFWLWPDGRTEDVCLPQGYLPGFAALSVYPTRAGYFGYVEDPKIRAASGVGITGGYLFRDGKAYKVISGFIAKLAISLGGCKVAMIHAPDWDSFYEESKGVEKKKTAKVIDLCANKDKFPEFTHEQAEALS